MPKDPICGMAVNEKTGLKLTRDGNTYFFCSEYCLKKFAKESKIGQEQVEAACLVVPEKPFYKNKTLIVSFGLVFLLLLSTIIPFLIPFRKSFSFYLNTR